MIPAIKTAVPDASVRLICTVLGVSRSWYYASTRRSTRGGDEELAGLIETIIVRYPGYGHRRITAALRRDGLLVNRKRVLRVMRERSLLYRRRKAMQTTTRAKDWLKTPNLVSGRAVTDVNQVWVADLTFIHLRHETGFLACILDACSRRCIGWAMGRDLTTDLTLRALSAAVALRQPAPGVIHHSDQGVQYANYRYRAALTEIKAITSMSSAGRPTENAYSESFFATLKREEVTLNEYADLADAERQIGRFIDQVYNGERLHSKLGYRTPIEFELAQVVAD